MRSTWESGRASIRRAGSGLRRASDLIRCQMRRLPARFLSVLYGLPEVSLQELVGSKPLSVGSPIFDHICLPPYHGPTDHNDLDPFLKLLEHQSPRIVLELGTAHGNLTANICRYCPDALVYSVNALAYQQTGSVTTYTLSEDDIGIVYRRYGYSDRVIQIFSDTLDLDLGLYLERAVADFAIIDACHDTHYVLNDFHKIRDFVRPGGIVLFHDTHPSLRKHLHGSYTACMMLRRQGYDVRHLANTWWAIWQNRLSSEPTIQAMKGCERASR